MSELVTRKYGMKPGLYDPRQLTAVFADQPPVDTYSLTALSPLPPVRDQGQLGCCVGEGTSGATHMSLLISKYPWLFTPSVLDIYYQCRAIEGTTTSDSGAIIADAFNVLSTQGVCPEDSNPEWSWAFSSTDDRWAQEPPAACATNALGHKIVKYAKIQQTAAAIESALYSGSPVVIGIVVYPSFESDNANATGVIPMPSWMDKIQGPLGGHCMWLYGYDRTNQVFTGRNSWGATWGNAGSFTIPYAYLLDPTLTSDLWLCGVLT